MFEGRNNHFARPAAPHQSHLHGPAGSANELYPAILPVRRAQQQFFDKRPGFFRQIQQKLGRLRASRNIVLVKAHQFIGGIANPANFRSHSQAIKVQLFSIGDRSEYLQASGFSVFMEQHVFFREHVAGGMIHKLFLVFEPAI